MDNEREKLKRLMVLEQQLKTALKIDDTDEIKKCFSEFKIVYKELTGKEFEEEIPREKLNHIKEMLKMESN